MNEEEIITGCAIAWAPGEVLRDLVERNRNTYPISDVPSEWFNDDGEIRSHVTVDSIRSNLLAMRIKHPDVVMDALVRLLPHLPLLLQSTIGGLCDPAFQQPTTA